MMKTIGKLMLFISLITASAWSQSDSCTRTFLKVYDGNYNADFPVQPELLKFSLVHYTSKLKRSENGTFSCFGKCTYKGLTMYQLKNLGKSNVSIETVVNADMLLHGKIRCKKLLGVLEYVFSEGQLRKVTQFNRKGTRIKMIRTISISGENPRWNVDEKYNKQGKVVERTTWFFCGDQIHFHSKK